MDVLPPNIMFDIFSRVPVKYLARSRCVSKVWCNYIDDPYLTIIHDKRGVEEPTPILYHRHFSRDRITQSRITQSLCFHVFESIQTGTTHDYVLKLKESPFLEFLRKEPLSESSYEHIDVLGSFNGLMCLSKGEDNVVTTLVVVHPLRKECYELPPFPLRLDLDFEASGTCILTVSGLGFNASTNTLKMVCVVHKHFAPVCTLVHDFGTNSWREIPQVPLYPIAYSSVMDVLPPNIMFDIFSRVPVKYLARSRCVSKVWCNYIDDPYLTIIHDKRGVEEPTPILYHRHFSRDRITQSRITQSLCFHVFESIQTGTTHDYVLKLKESPFLEFLRKEPLSESSYEHIDVLGSFNGLMCLSKGEDNVVTTLVVVHPLRKECYELPPFPLRLDLDFEASGTCILTVSGLGFNASTNTLKMVCVVHKHFAPVCTLVHEFGTNSWREIPQVPLYPIGEEAIFANGWLHWLARYSNIDKAIWFDVTKEEFGLINPPKRMSDVRWDFGSEHLVDLNGEVGYLSNRSMEVWVLKKKQWVPHCQFDVKQFDHSSRGFGVLE
ncbi:F-box domain-containing protein [Artemisia annua]|uniref:F-box domain-containing protein n=1 Tax=Artemisia annua TaxID=35608 RepID=A0A2U1LZ54_ARTAN|nr:F-box domain-containing protein [Artemisia annua]